MSDLLTGASGTSALGGGSGRTHNGAARAAPGPVPVNPHPPSGVRTPTDIMRQRREREGRRRAEQDARDRGQGEGEHPLPHQEPVPQSHQPPVQAQPPYAAGVDRNSQRRPTTSGAGSQRPDSRIPRPGTSTGQPGPPPSSVQPAPGSQQQQTQVPSPSAAAKPPNASQPQQQRRVAFPHAFERWETLSSHWEGLTGYWIRKLEQNNEDLERDPLSQQMARQVTDLSAAGANLFHAVVELQRLRASSERKFQRWFFETRAEQERTKEVHAGFERQIQAERQARTEATASVQKAEGDKTRAEGLLKEMRRELQISKDEARRAWEELGRREQEERDRTTSLRNGDPTLVGGVQVVPMIQGLPNRQNPINRASTQEEDPYSADEGLGKMPDPGEGHYYENQPESPTGSDPFTEGTKIGEETTAAPAQGTYPGHFYHPESSTVYHGRSNSEDDRSYVPSAGSSERGEEEYGGYRRDSQGRPIAYPGAMSEESDDYDAPVLDNDRYVTEAEYVPGTTATTNAPIYTDYPPTTTDFTGTWDSVTPRHRHPTRLSDVIEEEEPRTTPSRASRASRASRTS